MISLEIIDSNLVIGWDAVTPLTKIVISQNQNKVEFILSNYHEKFKVPHSEFINFQ